MDNLIIIRELIYQAQAISYGKNVNTFITISDNLQKALLVLNYEIENLKNDNKFNYDRIKNNFNYKKKDVLCRYWRANCCKYGNNCNFKHLKFRNNSIKLYCPFGQSCKYGNKCNCAQNIRNKNNNITYCNNSNNTVTSLQ